MITELMAAASLDLHLRSESTAAAGSVSSFWAQALEPDPVSPVESLIRCAPNIMAVQQHADAARRAAWKVRKYDLYERGDAARLSETAPALLAAAEACCEAASAIRRASTVSLTGVVDAITAAALAVA